MNEKIDRIQKSLEGFKEIHQRNSKEDKSKGYRELAPNGEYNKEYNRIFEEVKEILGEISKDENEKSFITYFSNLIMFSFDEVVREDLSWKNYVEIVKDSRNYLKYFDNLKKGCAKIRSTYRVVFDPNKLNAFCSNIIAEIA